MIVGVTYLDVSISKVIVKPGVFTFFGYLNKSGASLVAQCLKKKKNLPANAGGMGLSPNSRRSHILWRNKPVSRNY